MISKHDLSINELMVFNSEYKSAEKSAAVAYFMLLGGHLGLHRFYLNRKRSGIVQLLLFITAVIFYFLMRVEFGMAMAESTPSSVFIVTVILFGLPALALFIWVIVDLFLLPGMIKSHNADIERDILDQIVHYRRMEQLAGRGRPEYEA